jgi:DNA-binding transcriptional MerR regulator
MTRRQVERARSLRSKGTSLGKIARILGVPVEEVRLVMYPIPRPEPILRIVPSAEERAEREQGREHAQARRRGARRLRALRIQALWEQGWTLAEIAAKMEMSAGGLSSEISRLRRAGWEFPYRPRGPARRRKVAS